MPHGRYRIVSDRLLILGGTGFIGRNLANKAVKKGYKTVVLSLKKPNVEQKIGNVEYLEADTTNFAQLQEQLSIANFEYVVNLSGYIDHISFLDGGSHIIDAHFGGLQSILKLLDWNVLKRFVQIGSSDEYGNSSAPQSEEMREAPISPYSLGKVASSQLLQMLYRTEGLPTVTLRLFLVYGPGQNINRFLPQIIKGCLLGSRFPASDGEQLRDFCYVSDITDGILSVLTNDKVVGEIINLASGEPVTIREVVEQVQNIVGLGIPEFGKVPYRISENMELYANVTKAKELLDWRTTTDLVTGIEKTIHFISKNISK